MSSMFDGALIEYAAALLFEMRRKPGKEAILMAWNVEERARLWLEAWRLSLSGWHISVLADPIESPRPELFPTNIDCLDRHGTNEKAKRTFTTLG